MGDSSQTKKGGIRSRRIGGLGGGELLVLGFLLNKRVIQCGSFMTDLPASSFPTVGGGCEAPPDQPSGGEAIRGGGRSQLPRRIPVPHDLTSATPPVVLAARPCLARPRASSLPSKSLRRPPEPLAES